MAKGLCFVYCFILRINNRAWDIVQSLMLLLNKSVSEGSQHLPLWMKNSENCQGASRLIPICWESVAEISGLLKCFHPFAMFLLVSLISGLKLDSFSYLFLPCSKQKWPSCWRNIPFTMVLFSLATQQPVFVSSATVLLLVLHLFN